MNEHQWREALVGWGVEALGRWAGISPQAWPARLPSQEIGAQLASYGQLLSPSWDLAQAPGSQLRSILSLVQLEKDQPPQPFFVSPRPLSLEALLPGEAVSREALWAGFVAEFGQLPAGDSRFEAFLHLFYKYAWAVPCTYGEAGVSLYEEFKALAALVYASRFKPGPDDAFLLVGGDIPGIQAFVYTITSKGAAKSLRGRSFFLQLLGDAIVRRLVAELGLCPANVIYAAGGNFMLLAPAGSEAALAERREGLNRVLLHEFDGDLYLALACEALPKTAVGTAGFAAARERLGAKVAAAKSRCFAEIAARDDGWAALFEPQGQGGEKNFCQVCQREPAPGEQLAEEPSEAGEPTRKCKLCWGFEDLARALAAPGTLWMTVEEAAPGVQVARDWQGVLARLAGLKYSFRGDPPPAGWPGVAYIINPANPKAAVGCGFRFVANVTPRIEEPDRRWAQQHHPDLDIPPGEPIKDFELMALQSTGISRVGVLRMDVDNLGAIFGHYLQGSMVQTSALSAALDLFFCGHLNRACGEIDAQGEHTNVLYVIYAGGDDLFIVGAWDRMPLLAERVRRDFATYTGNNAHLTISGGIVLEGRKFPLYRAAERAGEAESRAKQHERRDGRQKDAMCFLGQVVGWEKDEWDLVRQQKDNLLWLIGEREADESEGRDADKQLPRALLQVVQSVYQLYRSNLQQARKRAHQARRPLPDPHMCLGRWAWMHVYSLTRMARRCGDKRVAARVLELQQDILQPGTVRLSGLAARWAEYLARDKEEHRRKDG